MDRVNMVRREKISLIILFLIPVHLQRVSLSAYGWDEKQSINVSGVLIKIS